MSVKDQQVGFEPKERFKLSLGNHFGAGLLNFYFKSSERLINRIEDNYSLSINGQFKHMINTNSAKI